MLNFKKNLKLLFARVKPDSAGFNHQLEAFKLPTINNSCEAVIQQRGLYKIRPF